MGCFCDIIRLLTMCNMYVIMHRHGEPHESGLKCQGPPEFGEIV